ncbi:MAG: response regulator receiver sensor signal transduction histidine kinase [Deferribacteraceae bacterium]|jgi:signal transduction histidine kinase|nr:response regulator receiver sensor signal transduction histidine kinase [Deferribacteraceae bacterium]
MTITDKSLKKNLDILSKSVERIASLVSNLLKYTKNYWMFEKEIKFYNFFEENRLYFNELTGNNIKFEIDDSCKDIMLNIDTALIAEAISNILSNANKAVAKKYDLNISDYKGSIIFRVTKINNDTLKISIIDNGVGMSKDVLAKAFEPFFTTEEMAHTQGLGLPSAKGIIESHKGRIEITSKEGGGTTVDIYLPIVKGGLDEKNV